MTMMSLVIKHQELSDMYGGMATRAIMRNRPGWQELALQCAYHRHLAYQVQQDDRIASDALAEYFDERAKLRESTTMYTRP